MKNLQRDLLATRPERKMRLSMGMSADYKLAMEYGADYVRIGTAIFGQRPYPQ